jgi:diguanylate cyclase (GGDEF)-like protein
MHIPLLNSIRFRLPALFLVAALVPALLSAVWSSQLLQNQIETMFTQRAQETAKVADNVFEEYTQDILLKTRIISQTQVIQEQALKQDYLDLINQLSSVYQDLNLQLYDAVIEVYDPSGHLMVAEPLQGQRLTGLDQVKAALKGDFKSSRRFAQGHLLISSAIPLYHPSKPQPIAVLGLTFRVSHKLADAIGKIAGSDVMLLSKDDKLEVLATTLDENTSNHLIQQLEHPAEFSKEKHSYILASINRPVSNGQYVMVAALSMVEMNRVIASVQNILLLLGGGGILLALLLALGLSQNILRKILALAQMARKVEARDLDSPVHLDSKDELGQLAQILDSMRIEIRQTLLEKESMIANLTIRDEINQAIISRSGNDLLLQVLMIILRSVAAQQGSIMLVDQNTQQLLMKVVYNPNTDSSPVKVHERISFSLGEGIAGHVANSGNALLCNDPLHDPRFKPYHFQEMDLGLQNLLCLPLKVDQTVLGVISLDNKPGGFLPEDLEQVQDSANQVAIAIKNAELYELSITDGMTGLYIRRYFQDMLEQELKRSQRFNMRTALIIFDIDFFKRFNDTYGHLAGDFVIKKVASLVGGSIRDGVDTPARYGGEEFAIIMPDTGLEGAYHVAERLRESIANSEFAYEEQLFKVTISLGCAEFPAQADSRDDLIEKADIALYASKHKGRNRSTCYSPDLETESPIKPVESSEPIIEA